MPLNNFISVVLPYCLKRLEDGTYVILNREYKPIGFKTREHIEYEDFPITHKIKGITKKTAEKLSWKGDNNLDTIFLYDGTNIISSIKMNLYLEKIKIISKYKIA